MWANTLLKRSRKPLVRTPPSSMASSLGHVDTIGRLFSSDDNREKTPPFNPQKGSGGGRGGGKGRFDRSNYSGPRGNNQQGNIGHQLQKPNFVQQFVDPAMRGELKHHKSSVPRHYGRKTKGHGVRGADVALPNELDEALEFMEMDEMVDFTASKPDTKAKTGTIANNSPMELLTDEERAKIVDFKRNYEILVGTDEVELYYWNERDYDNADIAERAEILARLQTEATRDADGNLMVEVDDETFALFDEIPEAEQTKSPSTQVSSPTSVDGFQFVTEMMGIEGADEPPPPDFDRVLPLELSGPTMYDFVESMMHHPSKFGEVRWEAPNEERDREPFAKIPPNRRNPPPEFVKAHKRFIYVWGLPSLVTNGEVADLENPMHCLEIQKVVGNSFDVPIEHVSVASPTSAFVGFPTIDDQKFAVAVGPRTRIINSPTIISRYDPSENAALANENPNALILLDNLPLGMNPFLLAESLFPFGTEVGEIYGGLSADRITFISPNSAVIAMQSADLADHAVTSALVKERLVEIGQHRIRYNKARRELVLTGTHGGPDGTDLLRKLGPRLIVDGDMPTKEFFTTHASTIFLRDLDPSVTKQDISDYFQPFCSIPRDVNGSTEFVTCREGLPTGRAFVGFDELGEAEAALEALSEGKGRLPGLGPSVVIADLVKERLDKDRRLKRSARSEEELLDSLNNWQQYVDPADLQYLMENDISVEALNETFRAIRYHNDTFASMDQAMRNETINPEKEAGGMFKELVQTYIETLKECVATPENPGPIYKSIHFPSQPIGTEDFDTERQRLADLRKRREVP